MMACPTPKPAPDFNMARRFLETLDRGAAVFDFRLIHDRDKSNPTIIRRGSISELWPDLVKLNEQGYGCFVTINETDGKGRTKDSIVRVRALFIDMDDPRAAGAALEVIRQAGLDPTMLVGSSAGRFHAYFVTNDVGVHEFEQLQKSLAVRFGSDPTIKDLPRVMRLPGTLHLKGGPRLVRLHAKNNPPTWTKAQIAAAFRLDEAGASSVVPFPLPARATSEIVGGDELGAGIERGFWDRLPDDERDRALAELLAALQDWALGARDLWIKGLMAASRSNAPNARDIAREWSKPYPHFDPAEFEKQWDSLGPGGPGQVSVATLIKAAADRDPDLIAKWRAVADGSSAAAVREPGEILPPENVRKTKYARALELLDRLGVVARRDTFRDMVVVGNTDGADILAPDHCGPLNDGALVFLRRKILERFKFDPDGTPLYDAIRAIAEEHRYNSVAVWLDGLTWDGKPRLRQWFPQIAGAPASALHEAIGMRIILAMAARARFPGTKFDICLVLEGDQGSGKSSLAKMLAAGPGEGYFCDAPGLIGMDEKERAGLLAGKWIVELGELSGMNRRDVESVKAFMSQSSDKYRRPYAREPVDQPRTCILIGTTNSGEYLEDVTGNRRFLPVHCGKIELRAFEAIRDQLFAEADHILAGMVALGRKAGLKVEAGGALPDRLAEKINLPSELWAAAAEAAEDRRASDLMEELLPDVVAGLEKTADTLPDGRKVIASKRVLQAMVGALGHAPSPKRLSALMLRLGWRGGKFRVGGRQGWQGRGFAKLCAPETSDGVEQLPCG
ncbi:VapE domain-containing protein [Rhodoblastus sp.]|uniref:VapE domain-containing protein n=1 Tax=Rhodoblastus sp. TaxID=1962975 RepID=UPI00262611EC|nr:VapE domain-containing protein [Rhodoblastus sp.]